MEPVKKTNRIAFVVDDRLSREKSALLNRTIQTLRPLGEFQLLPGSISEAELIKKLEAVPFNLVVVPWYRYLAWSKVEALYGLTRTSGPTFAGYHCEPLLPYEIGEQADHLRSILLDFGSSTPREMLTLFRALLQDTKRAGIRPLLEPGAAIYAEHWFSSQGIGTRLDTLLTLPEIHGFEWKTRANALRVCMTSFWSLIYEEGPGKSDILSTNPAKIPKASFQIGIDNATLVLRLCYCLPSSSPKDLLKMFWPDPQRPSAPSQLLLKFADFIRVHHIAEGSLIELVAGFQKSSPAELAHTQVHTLWIEPLAPNLMQEPPFDLPGPTAPHLRALPEAPLLGPAAKPATEPTAMTEELKAKERFINEAADKIRKLHALLTEKENRINEMRAGGIGTAPPLPPPDAESLLDAFQDRFFESRYQLRQIELQLTELENKGGSPQELEALKRKMDTLAKTQGEWLKKLAKAIAAYRDAKPPQK